MSKAEKTKLLKSIFLLLFVASLCSLLAWDSVYGTSGVELTALPYKPYTGMCRPKRCDFPCKFINMVWVLTGTVIGRPIDRKHRNNFEFVQ